MQFKSSDLKRRITQTARRLRRAGIPRLMKGQRLLTKAVRSGLSWMRTAVVGLLWLTFAGYIRAWEFLQPIVEDLVGRPLKEGHRALFCVAVSLVGGCSLMLRFTPFRLDLWSLLFWLIHGLVIHAYWVRGAKWCRRQLGIRPRGYDPARPFDSLDLGN